MYVFKLHRLHRLHNWHNDIVETTFLHRNNHTETISVVSRQFHQVIVHYQTTTQHPHHYVNRIQL